MSVRHTALCLMLAYFYRQSHRGLSYSVSLVHAMVLLGVTVSIIMLIIASDAKKNKELQRVELIGIYWHFVDVVWIFLFPLLYIAK